MNGPCLGPAAGAAVVWGEPLFAQLAGGMCLRKADWWQRLVQPGTMGGDHACYPWGLWGAPLGPSPALFPEGFGYPEAGPWTLGTRYRELGLFPLLPTVEVVCQGCAHLLHTCRATFLLSLEVSSGQSGIGVKSREPGRCYGHLTHTHLVARWRAEPGQREEGSASAGDWGASGKEGKESEAEEEGGQRGWASVSTSRERLSQRVLSESSPHL